MELTDLLSAWLTKIELENPPGKEIVALNFGMLNSDKGYMVYLTGAEVYDPDDDDWAGEIDYQPTRANKYLLLPREISKGLKWRGVLDLVAYSLKEIVAKKQNSGLFEGRVAAAGYDDSELILIKGI
jgi:hypothetical protein